MRDLFVSTVVAAALAYPAAAQQAGGPQDANAGVAARAGSTDATTPQNQATPPGGTTAGDGEEIVVTGLRASLATAQALKRNATQQIDSISAQDVGKLPDNTVSDALQRVTGVQVQRGGGETNAVLVRGLPNTATLINGREVFTGTARGVALQDIPAELIAGVDVYKSSTPDIVEGGVAGVIDTRLRRPFDLPGLQVAATGRGVRSDQSDKWGYLGSGLVSDRWTTPVGEVGALVGVSYNRRRYQDNTAFDFVSNGSPGIPDTVGGIYGNGQRTRKAINGALQWRPSPDLEIYSDAIYTSYDNRYNNDFFVGLPKNEAPTDLTVNSTYADYPFLASSTTGRNVFTISSQQAFEDHTRTLQADLGTKWQSDDHTTIVLEGVYNKSRLHGRNAIVDTSFIAPTASYTFDRGGTPLIDIGGVDLTDPSKFSLFQLFDNHSQSTSRQWAGRGDVEHRFDEGFLSDFKVGFRVTDRHVGSQATTSFPIPIPAGTAVLASDVPGFAQLSPGGLVKGRAGIDRFTDADPDFLRNDTDQVRAIFGQPDGARPYDPALAFFDDENTYAVYAQAGFRAELGGGMSLDGTAGTRVVNTKEGLTGNGVSSHENYTNVLPSVNARLHFTDTLQLRMSVGKTITRPNFGDLNPLVSYASVGATGNQGVGFTGAGGNPELQPIKSKAADVSLEWYPTPSTSVTAAGFYRRLNGYIQSYAVIEPYQGSTALVTRPRNTGKGSLKGAEVAYQQFFDFLPGALSGLGAQLNGTYINGHTQDPFTGRQERLVNVSKFSYNAVAVYEKYGISTRLAWNWLSSFVASYNSGGIQASTVEAKPTGQLDLSVNYELLKGLTLTFDATNLTDRVYHDRFKGVNAASQIYSDTPRDTRTYDRTFEFGARVKF